MPLSARLRKLLDSLPVDESTGEMSDAALFCRKHGHKWEEKSMSRKQYHNMLVNGVMTEANECDNGCGCTWTITYTIHDGEILEIKRTYPTDGSYRMPKGRGRLNRRQARVAYAARMIRAAA